MLKKPASFLILFSTLAVTGAALAQLPRIDTKPLPSRPGAGTSKPYCAMGSPTLKLSPPGKAGVNDTVTVTDATNGNFNGCQAFIRFSDGKIVGAPTTETSTTQASFRIPAGPSGAAYVFFVRQAGPGPFPTPTSVPNDYQSYVIESAAPVLTSASSPVRVDEEVAVNTNPIAPGDPISAVVKIPAFNKEMPVSVTFTSQSRFTFKAPDPGIPDVAWSQTDAQVILKRGTATSNALTFTLQKRAPVEAAKKDRTPGRGPAATLGEWSYIGEAKCASTRLDSALGVVTKRDSEEIYCCQPNNGQEASKCGTGYTKFAPDCAYTGRSDARVIQPHGCYVPKGTK